MTIQQMQNDFSNINNILTNDNHLVRQYFKMFLIVGLGVMYLWFIFSG